MCGVFGCSYRNEGRDERLVPTAVAKRMFPAIVHRGPDAFGWMEWREERRSIRVRKYVGAADDRLDRVTITPAANWFAGHVRWATHGSPSNMANNHPIRHGDVIGVHNGVLLNHEAILAKTGRQDDSAEVDSEAIFAAVDRWGTAGLSRILGDMVTVFVDATDPETLYIARSFGRELALGFTDRDSLVWASEMGVLKASGLRFTDKWYMPKNTMYVVRSGQIVDERDLPRAIVSKPKRRPTPLGGLVPKRGWLTGVTDAMSS